MTEVKIQLPDVSSLSAVERKSANKQIDFQLRQFPGKRIIDLLLWIKRCCSKTVLAIALERVERRKDELPIDDLVFFEGFKKSLGTTE